MNIYLKDELILDAVNQNSIPWIIITPVVLPDADHFRKFVFFAESIQTHSKGLCAAISK